MTVASSRVRPVLPVAEFLRIWERGEPAANGGAHPRLIPISALSVPTGPRKKKIPVARLPLPSRLVANFKPRTYGGLTRSQVQRLLWRCKAGAADLGAYLLATQWKRELVRGQAPSARLSRLTLTVLHRAFAGNRADFFLGLARMLEQLASREFREGGRWNHDAAAWWEFHLLFYILQHPSPDYRIREFRRHLADELGESAVPTPKTLRAFCWRHGIRLDSRPGAPVRQEQNSGAAKSSAVPITR